MEKIWLKQYPKDVPATIEPSQYDSLVSYFDEGVKKHQDKKCYTSFGTSITYTQLDEYSKAFAGALQNIFRLAPQDRIAIMMPNCLQYPVALFGTLQARMTVVNVNPLYTARELKTVLVDSGASVVVVLENFAHVVQAVLPETKVKFVIVTKIGDMLGGFKRPLFNFMSKYVKKMIPEWDIPDAYQFSRIVTPQNQNLFESVKVQPEDLAFLQYTGGTTGGTKGAMLTHQNMVSNVLQAYEWVKDLFASDLPGGVITAIPLYHIFALTANCLVFLRTGVENILITNPRDIASFVKTLQKHPFSIITGVNTLFNALLNNEKFRQLDFSALRLTLGGGMAVQRSVAERWQRVTGTVLLEAYGLTETCPAVCINPLNLEAYNGSVGLPIPSTDVKVCDEAGQELPLGEKGELWIKGPQVMKGYWQQPEQTQMVLEADGWFHSGDIAVIDEQGFVKIVDRKKDMINVSGFNVYPNEVEEVISEIEQVQEVAVIGIPKKEGGEVVKAYVVRADENLTEQIILDYCNKNLTRYKVPKEIEFRQELPKTNVGKILRRALREEK